MITNEIVKNIYKKYNKRPKSIDYLDMPLLFESVGINHGISIDPHTDELNIASIDKSSPFHKIDLKRVHAIVPFDEWTAIVLHSSIIFLNKKSPKVYIDIKMPKISLVDKIKMKFSDNEV